jgi:menaquinone-9 beta-reductase
VGLNAIGHNRTNVTLVVPSARARSARGRVEEFFSESLGDFPRVQERMQAGEVEGAILATGPFAARSRPVVVPGALLVGDAADFFDPVTGDGIYSALRGAEVAAETAIDGLNRPGPLTLDRLSQYLRRRRRVFAGKRIAERMIGYTIEFPRFLERVVSRAGRRHSVAHTIIGFAGGFVPVREVLNPLFLARMVL